MQATLPFLVYRDRIGVPSEIEFLRRQYIGFTRLRPVWTGRTVLADAHRIGGPVLRLGGNGPLGPVQRMLFRHLGRAPPDFPPRGWGELADGAGSARPADGRGAVLHAQFARGGALALPLVRALGLRMVVTLHGGDIGKRKNWSGTLLARRWPGVLAATGQFVCVSGAVAEVAGRRGVPDAKLTVLPIGVEVPEQPPAGRPMAHLFVGRFVEKKGIAVLIDAVRRLRAEGDMTPVVLVGDGRLRPSLEALARDTPGVTLTGWLSPEAVRGRMSEAICLVVPSVTARDGDAEGLPSVIPEAMAQACPVIGSDQGGIAEAIRHEWSGLLIPPGDAAALAAAMHRIGNQPGLRAALGLGGYAAASAELNARVQSAKLESLLLAADRGK